VHFFLIFKLMFFNWRFIFLTSFAKFFNLLLFSSWFKIEKFVFERGSTRCALTIDFGSDSIDLSVLCFASSNCSSFSESLRISFKYSSSFLVLVILNIFFFLFCVTADLWGSGWLNNLFSLEVLLAMCLWSSKISSHTEKKEKNIQNNQN